MKTIINKKSIGVWLPNKLFKNLENKLNNYNESKVKPKLDLGTSAYLLNLLFHIPLNSNEKYEDGWIPICSKPYKNLKYFKQYMEFLVDSDCIIEHDTNYSNVSNSCKRYKLKGLFFKQQINYLLVSGESIFIDNVEKNKIDRMTKADSKCNHLTKWLKPELLTIDYKNALSHIIKNYSKPNDLRKKNKRLHSIKSIKNKDWSYSREGKDDRLHTILTSLPKDLRRYTKYNNEELVSLDIKNSQPFIYSAILNQINKTNPDFNLMNSFINDYYNTNNYNNKLYISTMSDHRNNNIDTNGLESFINQVLGGTFYETYADILYKESILYVNANEEHLFPEPIIKRFGTYKSYKVFETKRKAAKYIMLKTLFSSEKCNHTINKLFEKHYPEVYRISQIIKKGKKKNFFPILLQNIEANCILDHCTRIISKNYPEMPLFTIHDSIITTSSYRITLENEFIRLLGKYFGLNPSLASERWSQQLGKVG